MIKLLKCEFMKTRRRWIFASAAVITAIHLVWALYGKFNDFMIENGWRMLLYQLPLTNTIFLPVLSVIVSSRLADTEHKGVMLKQLAVITDKGKVYDAKFIYGFAIVLLCILINIAAVIAFGYYMGFPGNVPLDLYLPFFLFTLVPTIEIYVISHTLSLLYKNQAVTFFTDILGTFAGLFSMFLPQIPLLRQFLPWGHYGALQFMGMFGWTKEERYANAYFENMGMDWKMFAVIAAVCVILYVIGRNLFVKKEM